MYRTYKEIRRELKAEHNKERAEAIEFIENGFLTRWGGSYEKNDDGIRRHSTERRYEQFTNGDITRTQAVEFAVKRELKKIDTKYKKKIAFLEEVEVSELPTKINISVEWKSSRTWGMNPTAEIWVDDMQGYTIDSASGCGYDKESAAIAGAAYNRASIVKVLCELKEKALRKNKNSDKSTTSATGINNREAVGYGAGYGVIPRLEGGVGVNCFISIFEKAGYTTSEHHGKTSDFYIFTR